MKEKIKLAFVGIGRRGYGMLKECFAKMGDVEITALCDILDSCLDAGRKILADEGKPTPLCFTDYDKMLEESDVDAVVIMTGWDGRPEMAKKAMLKGKYTAIEVGCSQTLEECFELIEVYEKTGSPLMMLENCCYGRREMMALNILKQGLFGEIVHCTGAYAHYLNDCDLFYEMIHDGSDEVTHYRLGHYIGGNRENYPTHELGPIAKVLKINRGNRFVKLSSFASKSVGIKAYAAEKFGKDSKYAKMDYKQGDVVNTIITCAGGETVEIKYRLVSLYSVCNRLLDRFVMHLYKAIDRIKSACRRILCTHSGNNSSALKSHAVLTGIGKIPCLRRCFYNS